MPTTILTCAVTGGAPISNNPAVPVTPVEIAHVDMYDRGAGLGGVDRLLRNLHRGDRDRRIVATDRRAAGDRTGEDGRWHGASAVLLRGL